MCSQHFQYCFGRAVFITYHTFIYSLTANTFWAGTLEIAKWAKHRWAHSPSEDLGLQSETLPFAGMGNCKDLWVHRGCANSRCSSGLWMRRHEAKCHQMLFGLGLEQHRKFFRFTGKERQPSPTRKSPPIFVFFCFSWAGGERLSTCLVCLVLISPLLNGNTLLEKEGWWWQPLWERWLWLLTAMGMSCGPQAKNSH